VKRRDILTVLGTTLIFRGTPSTRAQPATNVRRIGVLGANAGPNPAEIQQAWAPARALGWIEGQNLIVERRYAGGKPDLLRQYADELVRLNVEIILTRGTAATVAAKNATTRIPIVMISSGDPVRAGLVATLARPGGNITGYSYASPELEAKRLSLLHELLPKAQRVGQLIDATNPYYASVREESERAYQFLGMQSIIVAVAAASELERAVAEVARRQAQALIVGADQLFGVNRVLLMRAALRHSLPTVVSGKDLAVAGGLLSLAPDDAEEDRVFAYFVDKILRGAKPADLPVQQSTKFELVINLKTARALGLTIPQSLLVRADEVIS
jgi:putative ABC transport system substrate-binding protein